MQTVYVIKKGVKNDDVVPGMLNRSLFNEETIMDDLYSKLTIKQFVENYFPFRIIRRKYKVTVTGEYKGSFETGRWVAFSISNKLNNLFDNDGKALDRIESFIDNNYNDLVDLMESYDVDGQRNVVYNARVLYDDIDLIAVERAVKLYEDIIDDDVRDELIKQCGKNANVRYTTELIDVKDYVLYLPIAVVKYTYGSSSYRFARIETSTKNYKNGYSTYNFPCDTELEKSIKDMRDTYKQLCKLEYPSYKLDTLRKVARVSKIAGLIFLVIGIIMVIRSAYFGIAFVILGAFLFAYGIPYKKRYAKRKEKYDTQAKEAAAYYKEDMDKKIAAIKSERMAKMEKEKDEYIKNKFSKDLDSSKFEIYEIDK